MALVPALVASPAGSLLRFVKSAGYHWLDPSEKNSVSYFIDLMASKLLAERFLRVPWLMHLDVYGSPHRRYAGPAPYQITCGWERDFHVQCSLHAPDIRPTLKARAKLLLLQDPDRSASYESILTNLFGAPAVVSRGVNPRVPPVTVDLRAQFLQQICSNSRPDLFGIRVDTLHQPLYWVILESKGTSGGVDEFGGIDAYDLGPTPHGYGHLPKHLQPAGHAMLQALSRTHVNSCPIRMHVAAFSHFETLEVRAGGGAFLTDIFKVIWKDPSNSEEGDPPKEGIPERSPDLKGDPSINIEEINAFLSDYYAPLENLIAPLNQERPSWNPNGFPIPELGIVIHFDEKLWGALQAGPEAISPVLMALAQADTLSGNNVVLHADGVGVEVTDKSWEEIREAPLFPRISEA